MGSPEQPENSATDAPKPVSRLEAVKDGVEMFSKIILGMGAACFVCGTIVVNLYLREFGFASFSLFRVSYITAGVWTFSPIGFAALFIGAFLSIYFQNLITDEPAGKSSGWKKFQRISVAMFLAVILLAIIFSGLRIPIGWKWLVAIVIGAFIGTWAIAGPVAFLHSKTPQEKWLGVILGFFSLVGFLCYLLFLAPSLYRDIPASVGGGAGMPVIFVISTDNQEMVKAAGLTLAEPFRTNQVTLLLQTDKEYVILAGDPKTAITLSADLVSAIRFAPPK
jgi:hypothetical protein